VSIKQMIKSVKYATVLESSVLVVLGFIWLVAGDKAFFSAFGTAHPVAEFLLYVFRHQIDQVFLSFGPSFFAWAGAEYVMLSAMTLLSIAIHLTIYAITIYIGLLGVQIYRRHRARS
jgi:hypothetical protein